MENNILDRLRAFEEEHNPLVLYCRLREMGLGKKFCRRYCEIYEIGIYKNIIEELRR